MKDNGLIAPNGEIKSWDVSSIAPGFVFSGRSDSYVSREEIRELLNQGYYIIVQVKQKPATQFVAISGMEGNTVLMNDPASDATDLYSKYSGIYGYRIFRVE